MKKLTNSPNTSRVILSLLISKEPLTAFKISEKYFPTDKNGIKIGCEKLSKYKVIKTTGQVDKQEKPFYILDYDKFIDKLCKEFNMIDRKEAYNLFKRESTKEFISIYLNNARDYRELTFNIPLIYTQLIGFQSLLSKEEVFPKDLQGLGEAPKHLNKKSVIQFVNDFHSLSKKDIRNIGSDLKKIVKAMIRNRK